MSYKYDFPHPPHHYKSITTDKTRVHPDIDDFFAKVRHIYLFGQQENIKDASVRFIPNYLANMKNISILNKGFKTDLMALIEKLMQEFTDYIAALSNDPHSLLQRSARITDIITQAFYVIKVAKNTNESALQLNEILKVEIQESKRLIDRYKILIEELKAQLTLLNN